MRGRFARPGRRGVVLTVLFALLAVIGGVVAASPANAIGEVCDTGVAEVTPAPYVNSWYPPLATKGGAAERLGAGTYGATAYEWYGGQPIPFLTTNAFSNTEGNPVHPALEATCTLANNITSGIGGVAGSLWEVASMFNGAALWLYQWSMSMDVIGAMENTIIYPILRGTPDNGGGVIGGITDLYTSGSVIVFILVGVWAAVLILRRRTKQAMTGIAWSVGSVIVGLAILANPSLPINATKGALEALDDVATATATSIGSSLAGSTGTDQWCDLAASVPNKPADGMRKGLRENVCRMWVITYLEQWSRGQFGEGNPIAMTDKGVSDVTFVIPGLEQGPDKGSLVAMHLAATRYNPREQRWLDAQADKVAAARQLLGGYPTGGEEPLDGQLNVDNPDYAYPVGQVDNACPAEGTCWTNRGHNVVWQVLRDRAASAYNPETIPVTWAGTSSVSTSARWNALLNMSVGTASLVGVTLFFSVVLIWYQLILGLMLAFLPIPLLAMAFPRFGQQVARDFFSRFIQLLILTAFTTAFVSVTVALMMYVPDLLLGSAAAQAATSPFARFILAGIIGVAMIVLWWRIRKSLANRAFITGANPNGSAFDPSKPIAGAASKTAQAGVLVAGVAAGGAGVAAIGAMKQVGAAKAAAAKSGAAAPTAGADPTTGKDTDVVKAAGAAVSPAAAVAAGVGPTRPTRPETASTAPTAAIPVPVTGPFTPPAASVAAAPTAPEVKVPSFGEAFRSNYASSMSNYGWKATSALLAGGGVAGVMMSSRNTLNEIVTGQQVKTLVTDSRGRQSITETGIDRSMGTGSPAGGVFGGPRIDPYTMANAMYAATALAMQHQQADIVNSIRDGLASPPPPETPTLWVPDSAARSGLEEAPPPRRRSETWTPDTSES